MLDLKITGARIVDGSGRPSTRGAVGVKDGRIVAIGEISDLADQTVDAEGCVVAPGIVDVHTHYDAQAFWDPTLSPSCYHGVTTVFGGFCGFSIAPLTPEAAPYLLRMLSRVEGMPLASLEQGVPWTWRSFAEYLGALDGHMGVNAGFMAGHSALRCVVMGEARARSAKATAEELSGMKKLLAQSISDGAMGFSSTVSTTHNDSDGRPVPSRHASNEELIALAGVCRDFEGTTLEFLPGVPPFSDEIIDLMVAMSLAAKRPLNWNVLQAGDRDIARNQLQASDRARAKGADILALTAAQTPTVRVNLYSGFVFDALAGWAEIIALPIERRIEQLRLASVRAELDRRARAETKGFLRTFTNWGDYVVDATFEPANKRLEGRSIGSIAVETGRQPLDVMIDLAISEGLHTSFLLQGEDDDVDLWKHRGELWRDSRTVIGGSDAGAHLDMIDTFANSTQVLARGVREYGVISLEEAVRQLTSVPAEMFGLRRRGRIALGWHADLMVFDPQTIARGPTYMRRDLPGDEPRVYADAIGIRRVFVNGVEIVRDGIHTGALPGKILRSGRDTATPPTPVHAGAPPREEALST